MLIVLCILIIIPINQVDAETTSVTNKDDFLEAMNDANDGDIIRLEDNIDLIAGNYGDGDCFNIPRGCLVILDLNGKTINIGSGSASNNFGVGSNSALLIKNGKIENIDTNDTDNGILILSGVIVTNNICTGSTQMWIVNNSSVENILLVEEGGLVNPGCDDNMHPLSEGFYDGGYYKGKENPAPAMVGSGVTWKCLNTLQEDFDEANNDTTGTYKNIIFLKDSMLEGDSNLTAGGINVNLGGYTLTTGDYHLSINNETDTNKIYSGTINGDLFMDESKGGVNLSDLDVTGTINNISHQVTIKNGHYKDIANNGNDVNGKVIIEDGFYSGNLTGTKYEISGGYFVNKPESSYIVAPKDAIKCVKEEKGIKYNYTIGEHEHIWKYTANNNCLYAYCEETNCAYYGNESELSNGIKLVLNAPNNCVYSGSPIEATIDQNNSDINAWCHFFEKLPVIKYQAVNGSLTNGDAVNTGQYKANISVGEINITMASVSFEIIKNESSSNHTTTNHIVPKTGIE